VLSASSGARVHEQHALTGLNLFKNLNGGSALQVLAPQRPKQRPIKSVICRVRQSCNLKILALSKGKTLASQKSRVEILRFLEASYFGFRRSINAACMPNSKHRKAGVYRPSSQRVVQNIAWQCEKSWADR
jgi:hypothetical protein